MVLFLFAEVLVYCKSVLLVVSLFLLTLAPRTLWSEQGTIPVLPGGPNPGLGIDQGRPLNGQRSDPEDEQRMRAEREMAKRANQERQNQLKRDTEHLLKLATELQEYVDKSNENILSLNVVKKAEEIEKLAHSVKEKMKGQ